jgi:hypothetical protein
MGPKLDLPAGYLDMLHILPAILEQILFFLSIALLILIALFALAYWLLYRRTRQSPPLFAPAAGWIKELEKEFLASRNYRAGCHALALRAREFLEERSGLAAPEMTAREIENAFKMQGFFLQLSDLQFGEREPDESDFKRIVELARQRLRSINRFAARTVNFSRSNAPGAVAHV